MDIDRLRNDHLPRRPIAKTVIARFDALGLTRQDAAKLVDDAATQISRLYTGNIHEFSADRLIGMLLRTGCDVRLEITMPPKNGARLRRGKVTVETRK